MKTRSIKKNEINSNWIIIDVAGIRLGKAASTIAQHLIGKNKVERVDYLPSGDNVVIINSDKIDVFPRKLDRKMYYTHSGYIGGLKTKSLREMMEKDSREVIRKAVWGMLPKTKIGRKLLSNMRVYKNEEYNETAQKPEAVKID